MPVKPEKCGRHLRRSRSLRKLGNHLCATSATTENVKPSIDKCIQMTTDLVEAFEQRNLFTEQEIMTLYLWKDRLIKEKPKLMKQTTVDNWMKRATSACKQATADHPAASTTDATDVSADASQLLKLTLHLTPQMSLQ